MSTQFPEIIENTSNLWKKNERNYIMNEPKHLIRRNGKLEGFMTEVDPRTISKVDEFADFATEGIDDITQTQQLIETITDYILSFEEDQDDATHYKWNRTVSRVSNWVYLRALWIRSNVALSMVVPYIYGKGVKSFGFKGKTPSLNLLMADIARSNNQDLLLGWDIEDPHVVYIMRALTERLNLDRLQYLRRNDEQD